MSEAGGGVFDFPNEGEVELNPSFVCESCGYANVRLITANGKPAAKCTNCGQGYLETEPSATDQREVADQ